jgi:hypothetical protein
MYTYLLEGLVYPLRDQLCFSYNSEFYGNAADLRGKIDVDIDDNKISVKLQSNIGMDVYDLRNSILVDINAKISVLSYIHGLPFRVDIVKITCEELEIDHIYSNQITCVEQFVSGSAVDQGRIFALCTGESGLLIGRCMVDMGLAMTHVVDTAFYCYRAIESLMRHCALSVAVVNKERMWEVFREKAGCTRDEIMEIKKMADPLRHGGISDLTAENRKNTLLLAWRLVAQYLMGLPVHSQ